jgi:hypothetical protein
MGNAVWWSSTDAHNDESTRHLEGEIKLAKDLRPTSEMGHFSISVSNLVAFSLGEEYKKCKELTGTFSFLLSML